MFHEASNKLSAIYLAIIMAISIFFSVNIYQVSVAEFNRDFSRQEELLNSSSFFPQNREVRNQFLLQRAKQYEEAKQRILVRLIIINGFIFISGGFLSYYFARRSLEPIEKSHAALERFTADASHELRTPITAMQTEIEVALSDPNLNLKDARQQLESNLEELSKLTQLSEQLLELAHTDNRQLELKKVKVGQLVGRAVKQVSPLAKKKQIKITVEGSKDTLLLVNRASIVEVLTIFLDNAIKYSPEKSLVTVTTTVKKEVVTIAVTDNGPGIAAKDLDHIFERFYRADKSRTHQEQAGHGLGLSIAKSIVERNNGSVAVKSRPEKGATFQTSFPIAPKS